MSEGIRAPRGGRGVVAAVWAAAGAVHLWIALDVARAGMAGATVSGVLAAVAVVGVVALVATEWPGTLLAAAVAGAVGVAGFLVPMAAALPGFGDVLPSWSNPWPFAAFLLDALTVRLAVFVLRRATRVHAG